MLYILEYAGPCMKLVPYREKWKQKMHAKLCVGTVFIEQHNNVIKVEREPARAYFLQCHYNKRSFLPGVEDDHILLIVGLLWVLWPLPPQKLPAKQRIGKILFKKTTFVLWKIQKFRSNVEYFIKSYFFSISNLDFILAFLEGKC